jgi:GT2 family glycosyltransferase
MKDLSIIIVNYNVKEFVENLLNSIDKARQNLSLEIFVVDNASDDGSVDVIKEKFPYVTLIANKTNIGFGAANNLALSKAAGKYLLLINPDTIVKEDTFVRMIGFFEKHPDAGVAGCKVLNSDGTLQLACRRSFPGPWTSFTKVTGLSALFPGSRLFARYNLTYLDENKTHEVDAVSGSFMMMRRETYNKVGGFDEQFFMYGEDIDLCYRTQKAGYKVFYVHETEIIHYKGESTKRSSIDETQVFYHAMHLFVRKHLSSSFIVELILQFAIFVRKMFAFLNIYRLIIVGIVIDFTLFSFSLFAAEKIYCMYKEYSFPEYSRPWVYLVPAFIQIVVSAFSLAYKKYSISILRSLISLFYGMLLLSTITYFFKGVAFSRALLLINFGIVVILFPLWRIIFKAKFKTGLVAESRKARTVVVGTGENALLLAHKLDASFTHLYFVAGLIAQTRKQIGEKHDKFSVVGSLENIKKVISENKIDKVIFSSEEISYNQMFAIVAECQGENVEFVVAGNDLNYLVGKSSISMLDDIPLLKIQYNISAYVHRVSKRALDVILSSFIIIFLFPFMSLGGLFTKKVSRFRELVRKSPKVFSGKYSFVGPKSEVTYEGLYVGKPGLTGFWYTEDIDINDAQENKKLDIFYAKNQNIWLDLEIIGKSFSKMFYGDK